MDVQVRLLPCHIQAYESERGRLAGGTTCFHDFVHSVRVQTIPLALGFFLLPLPPTITGRTSSAAATVWQRRLRRRFLFEILNCLCPLNPTTLPFIPHLTILAHINKYKIYYLFYFTLRSAVAMVVVFTQRGWRFCFQRRFAFFCFDTFVPSSSLCVFLVLFLPTSFCFPLFI